MRALYCLLYVLVLVGCEQKPQLPEINYKNIQYLTLDSLSNEDKRAMAIKQLSDLPFAEYQQMKKDETIFNARIKQVIDELQQQRLVSSTQFSYHANVSNRRFNQIDQTLNLSYPFKSGQLRFRSSRTDGILPEYIQVLIANTDQLLQIPVSEIEDFNPSFKSLRAHYVIEMVEAQNKRFLQAVIKQAELYQGEDNDLIYRFSESREPTDVVTNRLLSGGYSLNLTPVHSFSFFNRRVLDPFYDIGYHNDVCSKQGELYGHQSILCTYQHIATDTGTVYLDVLVVGGANAEISLMVKGELDEEKQSNVLSRAMNDLNLKSSFLAGNYSPMVFDRKTKNVDVNGLNGEASSDGLLKWEYFGVMIEFNPLALSQKDEQPRTVFKLKAKSWVEYKANKKGA